tara:strand:- start:533 stop:1519 length:987 start_codon:yes stop_codon:yes gene_type:complete
MALNNNPTKTRSIENAFRRENKKRFAIFSGRIKKAIDSSQILTTNFNTRMQRIKNANGFDMSEQEYTAFIKFLRNQAYRDIIGVFDPMNANSAVTPDNTDLWQEKYIAGAYARNLDMAAKDHRRAGQSGELTTDDLKGLYGVVSDTQAAQIMLASNPLHGATVASLQQSSLTLLVQNIETMLGQLATEIDAARSNTDTGTTKLKKQLSKRVKVADLTGQQIARTQTIQAAQEAQINSAGVLTERLGQPVKVRWITRNDAKVRHLHAQWHGEVMTPEEAKKNITISPWNCRCGFQQVSTGADTVKRQKIFDKERAVLVDKEKKQKLGSL